jgi:hypothetical protein
MLPGTPIPVDHDPRRSPGQPVLSRLRSTEDFKYRFRLDIGARRLILFLIVVLADDEGRLTRTHEVVLDAYGGVPGHWASGKDLHKLRKMGSKFLGRAAERLLPWHKIADIVNAAVPEEDRPWVLAHAAGLYCQATKQERPSGDYRGQILEPSWSCENPLTVHQIRASLGDCKRSFEGIVPGAVASSQTVEADTAVDDPANLRLLLDTTVRGFRETEAQLERVKTENSHLRMSLAGSQSLLDEVQDLRRRNQQLQAEYRRLLRRRNPSFSDQTLDAAVRDVQAAPPPVAPLRLAGGSTATELAPHA